MRNEYLFDNEIHYFQINQHESLLVENLCSWISDILHLTPDTDPVQIMIHLNIYDAGLVQDLSLNLKEVLRVALDRPPAVIALVLLNNVQVDIAQILLKTITQRNQIETFMQTDKAHQWLELMKKQQVRSS